MRMTPGSGRRTRRGGIREGSWVGGVLHCDGVPARRDHVGGHLVVGVVVVVTDNVWVLAIIVAGVLLLFVSLAAVIEVLS